MLGDLAPRQSKEIKQIKLVLEFGFSKDIAAIHEAPISDSARGRQRLTNRITEEIGLAPEKVNEILDNLLNPLIWVGVDEEVYKVYQRANNGDSQGQQEFALMCLFGSKVDKDPLEAAKWMAKAAEQGNAEAQMRMGVLYSIGVGVEQNNVKAFEYTKKAADKKLLRAVYNLGVMHLYGIGTPKDVSTSVELFNAAANQGFAKAMIKLGQAYDSGLGVNRDSNKAFDLYRKALLKDNSAPGPYLEMARHYEYGLGVEKDQEKSQQLKQLAEDRKDNGVCEEIRQLADSLCQPSE
jgi:TPR repeat protein